MANKPNDLTNTLGAPPLLTYKESINTRAILNTITFKPVIISLMFLEIYNDFQNLPFPLSKKYDKHRTFGLNLFYTSINGNLYIKLYLANNYPFQIRFSIRFHYLENQ